MASVMSTLRLRLTPRICDKRCASVVHDQWCLSQFAVISVSLHFPLLVTCFLVCVFDWPL